MTRLSDVARHLGLSNGTVSLAINGSPLVKEETRARVMQAVRELGYVPNASARALVTRRQLVIGVVRCTQDAAQSGSGFADTVDTYLSDMLRGIERESVAHGYSLMVDWANTSEPGCPMPGLCTGGKVDGVLLVGGLIADDLPERLKDAPIPTVLAGSRNEALSWVDADYEEAMRQAVSLLAGHGHRRIALLNGPAASKSSERKRRGFEEEMARQGLPLRGDWMASGDFSGQGGYEAMRRVWSASQRPTAFVAAADCMALGALRYLQEMGVCCPRDISAVGYEDGLLAEYSIPPLTTVSARKEVIGREACRLLMERIAGSEKPSPPVCVSPLLVERASVRTLEPTEDM